MAVAERPAGIAAVEHAATVVEHEMDARAADHTRCFRAGIQPRPQQSAHDLILFVMVEN